jgi:ATP-binding cassette subfamily A (ABC1) protein 3
LGIQSYGVGITTLEEVFLKIAEDPEELEHDNLDEPKKALLNESNSKMDDYSIVEDHEEGVFNTFMLSLRSLLKKKWLLYVRDPRTLIIEMMFPIIFIFLGLFLATIKPIREGVPRPLSPTILPQPSHLVFNNKIPHPSLVDTKSSIIDGYFSTK